VPGRIAEREDTFGYLVDFQEQVVVQFLKFQVEFKKLFALDISVVTPHILVKNGVVGQQNIQLLR